MTQQHPIAPPSEVIGEWWNAWVTLDKSERPRLEDFIAVKAAQYGADQELEACCEWLHWQNLATHPELIPSLRAARRPKPSSLKEQAIFAAAVLQSPDETCSIAEITQHWHTIRCALESLPD
jgi:hypothetical protein